MRMRMIATGILAAGLLMSASGAAASTGTGYWWDDLNDGKQTVRLGESITVWECWAGGRGTPELWTYDGTWTLTDKATIKRDLKMCGKKFPLLATYQFVVPSEGTWNESEGYFTLQVRTMRCSTCKIYNWTMPVTD